MSLCMLALISLFLFLWKLIYLQMDPLVTAQEQPVMSWTAKYM